MASSMPQGGGSGDHAQKVAQHYNQIQETGKDARTQSRIFFLRNFNNWVKSVVIADTLDKIRKDDHHKHVSVLDLASGKGGDLLKWKKGRINHLVCADIAETSVQQCAERHQQNKERERYQIYEAEFIAADCTRERLKTKYKNPNMKFDLVSCQFAFHYCFESYPQAMMMLRNACECLNVGGYFIGTTPNSADIIRRLQASSENSFGNDIYSISFDKTDKKTFPLFGARYDFHLEGVVDCPEFLVHFPAMKKLAEQYGMSCVTKLCFADFFKEHCANRENNRLLGNMQALEPYPPFHGVEPASSKPEDYASVAEFYKELSVGSGGDSNDSRGPRKLGTLSLAEWEAATVYLVFVFQKVSDVTPPFTPGTPPATPDAAPTT